MDTEAPDLYTDSVQIQLSPFGALFVFMLAPAGQAGGTAPKKIVNLRMSLEHAKVLAILLRKEIQRFESAGNLGETIPIHPKVLQTLGISRQEDW